MQAGLQVALSRLRPYSICQICIQIHSESGFGFTGKSNGLDSRVLSEVTPLLFVYVFDTDVTSGFGSESTSKLDSLDSRIRIRIRQIEYGLREPHTHVLPTV